MMITTFSDTQILKNANYFDDLQIIAAFQKKFRDNSQLKNHFCKRKYYSLEMICSGKVRLRLDKEIVTLESPCVFWIGDHHATFEYIAFPGCPYEHAWVDFSGERGSRIYESLCRTFGGDYAGLYDPQPVAAIFRTIADKFRIPRRIGASAENTLLIEKLVFEILRNGMEEQGTILTQDTNGLKYIEMLSEKIKNSPFEEYDPEILAQQQGVSCAHFRSLFKKITSKPIHQFILEQQMLTAGELLKNGQFRIGELADYCNFSDTASFTRAFKRYYELSPRQWLQENGKDPSFL